jgi:exo-beta-1,3-glucanase (GH17 family)
LQKREEGAMVKVLPAMLGSGHPSEAPESLKANGRAAMYSCKGIFFAAVLLGSSSAQIGNVAAQTPVNGVNYDPAHSAAYLEGQAKNNLQQMTNVINNDLSQIKIALNFSIIKTYYSEYCTYSGQCVSIAELANAAGLQIFLGVYEFPAEPEWTKAQVKAAIAAAKNPTYGKAVIGIVVGNEDMFDYRGAAIPTMQRRIVADIKTIMAQVTVPVTTAQRQGDWCGGAAAGCDHNRSSNHHPSLNQSDPYGVLKTLSVIGVNIFPYWGGSPEQIDGVSVASQTQTTAMQLQKQLGKNVIVTEEGWPSCFNPGQNSAATLANEQDYFTTWSKHQNQMFDSVYFMAYDLANASECGTGRPGGDANLHFGLCTNSGANKVASCSSPQ